MQHMQLFDVPCKTFPWPGAAKEKPPYEDYKAQMQQQGGGGAEGGDGHVLADSDAFAGVDFDKVWQEFSEKLAAGEVKQGENGQMVYDVGTVGGPFEGLGKSWWDTYGMHALMFGNLAMMFFMQQMRRKDRARKEAEAAEQGGEASGKVLDKGKAAAPGGGTEDDEDDPPAGKKKKA
eukprot:TRINITY_DN52694_c0_g2_i1.p1 TRINITY_DN52694_c0_g2~~TRINITY_DN52694_c0_g2_i1.p1  ORF type:complete len:199 (-),score=45.05 TRINITY_DN52694_c0_g2_i1:116-646(-)